MFHSLKREVIKDVCNSLKYDPESWELDGYRANSKKLNISVWYANSVYGMTVDFNRGHIKFGDVTVLSVFFGWFTWRRKIMWYIHKIERKQHMANLIAAKKHYEDNEYKKSLAMGSRALAEAEFRKTNPATQLAWDQYQNVLILSGFKDDQTS